MSATGAAAAAAARRRRQREEEESMTSYEPQDLADGWEFKIVRSATAVFRRPEELRRILAEEARAGWVLLEKFDDHRVRLKRPASAKHGDSELDSDAYRTRVGVSEAVLGVCIAGGILALIALVLGIAAVAAKS